MVLAWVPLKGGVVSRPRVLLADDHRVVSEGSKHLLAEDFELVGAGRGWARAGGCGEEAEARCHRGRYNDAAPHRHRGNDQLKNNAGVKVVFLDPMHQDPAYARRALEAGAAGFVVKHSAPAELVMAIQAAMKGQTFVTPALAGELWRQSSSDSQDADEAAKLTPR
jgi:DNA-binding NarL/FixJ family response regulator